MYQKKWKTYLAAIWVIIFLCAYGVDQSAGQSVNQPAAVNQPSGPSLFHYYDPYNPEEVIKAFAAALRNYNSMALRDLCVREYFIPDPVLHEAHKILVNVPIQSIAIYRPNETVFYIKDSRTTAENGRDGYSYKDVIHVEAIRSRNTGRYVIYKVLFPLTTRDYQIHRARRIN